MSGRQSIFAHTGNEGEIYILGVADTELSDVIVCY